KGDRVMLFAVWNSGSLLELAVGSLLGCICCYFWTQRQQRICQQDRVSLLQQAKVDADDLLSSAKESAESKTLAMKLKAEDEIQSLRSEATHKETRLNERESLINRQLEGLVKQEQMLQSQHSSIIDQQERLKDQESTLKDQMTQGREKLEAIARLNETEAREILLKEVEHTSLKDAQELSRHIMEDAKRDAETEARKIISLAIQRYAGEHTFDCTTSTVALTGDELKGRIIGREGRNIRAFEAATGVTVLIDDTPNAVVLSAFDPVRREIAREAMSRLIADGRIHPSRIEEVVHKVQEEIEETVVRLGEEATYRTGIPPLHPEITKTLGRLHFRNSFSQNVLNHSVEVAHLTGLMAIELGVDVTDAKKSGLLHDIGKAINHEMEGSHAIVGADYIRNHGEKDPVANAVAAHHDEVPHTSVYGILVSAADAISASRPGARSESMTTYIQRLQNLEDIGKSFDGVEKCFAVQAGREMRVVVSPDSISDEQAFDLSRKLARKIEDELQYPGQIRITVIRETRCIEFAK
ncbi:ribonuclease Y, partial [Verrucomicrobia bacterium]|nr:ribonuclease Y [Verrucomicrobiota bacterium]